MRLASVFIQLLLLTSSVLAVPAKPKPSLAKSVPAKSVPAKPVRTRPTSAGPTSAGPTRARLTSAGPTPAKPTRTPSPSKTPPLPSIAECKKHLHVPRDSSFFYTGGTARGSGRAWVAQWIKKNPSKKKYGTLRDHWTAKDQKWIDQWGNSPNKATVDEFWGRMSQAYAEMSTGTVYVMLPKNSGYNWERGRVWDVWEWPRLRPDVTVIRVNPTDNTEEVLKGKGSKLWPSFVAGTQYTGGVCSLKATQWDLGGLKKLPRTGNKRFDVEVTVYDSSPRKEMIGYNPPMNAGEGRHLKIKSKLKSQLDVTPENGGNIRFRIGTTSWKSSDKAMEGKNGCTVNPWTAAKELDGLKVRTMDCSFAC